MSQLRLSSDIQGRLAVISLTGELDLAGSIALEAELACLVRDCDATAVVVDLSALDFMDSTGLRTLVLADRRLGEDGRRFALVPGQEPVQRVFSITRMDRRLRFVSSAQEMDDSGPPRE